MIILTQQCCPVELLPYDAVEPRIKELLDMVENQRNLIDEAVKDYENRQKEAKEQEVRKYYDKKAIVLGDMADTLYPMLFDKKWVNASTTKAKYEEGIQVAINGAQHDIEDIQALNSPFVETLLAVYTDTLSMESVQAKQAELSAAASAAGLKTVAEAVAEAGVVAPVKSEEIPANPEEGMTLKIHANQNQLNQLYDFMKAIGVSYEVL